MLINGTDGFRCCGAYRTMEEALDKIKGEVVDVVLSDIGLPGMSGIEGIRILKERYPNLLLLMLSVYDDDERIFDALCAGACGYLLKRTSPARLIECSKKRCRVARRCRRKWRAEWWLCFVTSARPKGPIIN